ncbi:peptidylprolyl isomerase [Moraxella sp. FZLJ2107]|uniref:FKBP-type peptidyl-prolyl cis-trans isomerase n=1 Tax=unclassified Moraxella TaxID=2685852 RepID=UPI00209C0609|nr:MULTISPECIES: peptidylprolyl isomerase [unclassified Moraxella]USZ15321.1 peptidylprolyl isomerase [Moraxella sp. FZFQ2102]UTO06053.1 peptidylprolyl isomerase [Moraxella sp. FZLJ2107]UTO22790.1 peptidylprolyl isomerase [Moraxella sp. FZLJ2109]
MTTIANDTVVKFNYTLTNDKGETLDQSQGEPLAYLHGHHNIIPGLEKEMTGKKAGDKFKVTVKPEEAYGEYIAEAVQEVPRANFQGVDNIEVGMQFQSQTDDGHVMLVTVKDVNDEVVVVDGNHPLAGVELTFDVEIVEVRAATADEIAHGHAHGVGGHHH